MCIFNILKKYDKDDYNSGEYDKQGYNMYGYDRQGEFLEKNTYGKDSKKT